MKTLAELEQAKLDAETLYDIFYAGYDKDKFRAMTHEEYTNWKAESYRLWSAAVDAQFAFYKAEDQQS